eukprot:g20590.t1
MFVQATVREESTLLDFVHSNLGPSFPQWFSKKVARFRIGDGLVQVNGVPERFLHLQLQAGDVVSIDAHRVRAVHRERAATTESRTDRRPASAPNTEQSSMRRSMRLLDLVHLKLGLSLMESRRAIQEGRVQVDATIIADIARFMDLDSTLTLLPRPQGVQTSELRIEHLELEFMVVWKPADMTVKELCFKESCFAFAQELGYATPVGPGEGRGRGTVEPIESFVLQRSAQVVAAVAACEERPGSLDGSVAVYGLLRAAIVKRRAKCPLLKQHGALVLEVPPSLERRVCSLFSNEVKPARGTDCASIASRYPRKFGQEAKEAK